MIKTVILHHRTRQQLVHLGLDRVVSLCWRCAAEDGGSSAAQQAARTDLRLQTFSLLYKKRQKRMTPAPASCHFTSKRRSNPLNCRPQRWPCTHLPPPWRQTQWFGCTEWLYVALTEELKKSRSLQKLLPPHRGVGFVMTYG